MNSKLKFDRKKHSMYPKAMGKLFNMNKKTDLCLLAVIIKSVGKKDAAFIKKNLSENTRLLPAVRTATADIKRRDDSKKPQNKF